jgi:hypothetical protein
MSRWHLLMWQCDRVPLGATASNLFSSSYLSHPSSTQAEAQDLRGQQQEAAEQLQDTSACAQAGSARSNQAIELLVGGPGCNCGPRSGSLPINVRTRIQVAGIGQTGRAFSKPHTFGGTPDMCANALVAQIGFIALLDLRCARPRRTRTAAADASPRRR